MVLSHPSQTLIDSYSNTSSIILHMISIVTTRCEETEGCLLSQNIVLLYQVL